MTTSAPPTLAPTPTPAPAPAVIARSRWLSRNERSLFLLGTALVVLHVLDDTLLQPPAGTNAADHLVSSLVPTVLLAAAVWGFGRVRAAKDREIRCVMQVVHGNLPRSVAWDNGGSLAI